MPAGRPSSYTKEVGDKICEIISTSEKGLSTIEKMGGMPSHVTILKWLRDIPEFLTQYTRAKEEQSDFMAEQIISIADDGSKDTFEGHFGPQENKEWTSRSKLRVEARKWVAAKLKPKKYGDKIDHTTQGEKINSFDFKGLTFEELNKLANEREPTDQAGSED